MASPLRTMAPLALKPSLPGLLHRAHGMSKGKTSSLLMLRF